jgi:hypothetical protein
MKAIIICPEHRATGGVFHRMKPLALMPIMGRALLDHAFAQLKKEGFTEVLVLASDRPEMIREATGNGGAWGLKVEVIATRHEVAADIAELHHGQREPGAPRPRVMVLEEMVSLPGKTLWQTNYATFDTLRAALQMPELTGQLTMQEASPGVWISTKARISRDAEITGPVWIGPHASIRAGAKVGPHTIVESGAFIDGGAVIEESWIGPATYVGATATIKGSFAWGDGLLNWSGGSFVEVRDSFLLNDLTRRTASQKRASLLGRLAALLLMLITAPFAIIAMLSQRLKNKPAMSGRRVILPPSHRIHSFSRTHHLLQLNGVDGLLRRWPELWRVIRGDMALVGNRPLSLEEASALRGPMAQLWLESPAGVLSLADAEGADPERMSECLAHAAYFTARRTTWLKVRILFRCLFSLNDTNEPMPIGNFAPSL